MIGTLVTLFFVGLVTLVVVGVVLSILGVVFSLALGTASFLLFKVAPVIFVGWLILKLLEGRKRPDQLSAADRQWLDGGR